MAETPNRHLGKQPIGDTSSPPTTEMKAAIDETRTRLSTLLTRTADHIDAIFTYPTLAPTEPRDVGFVGAAIKTIATVGRTKRMWSDARRTGLLRRSTVVAVVAGIALALATKTKRH